ncbi:MAG: 3-deoxy-D-manno-octulosonic acid transferase [Rhodospirillales bacterium]|nr:3-deoxy-D-manno-octulosonic acid transferase [Rhodospirillales bacterium]
MILNFYRALSELAAPAIVVYLRYRKAKGKEDRLRFSERLGRAGRDRPVGPLVWAHAASIGESLSLLPLIERLLSDRPGLNVLVTTGTVTSAGLLAERLPQGCFHQYVPVDRIRYARRFLDFWRPDLVLWAESDFWPNLITETVARKIPMVLVNGRISARSFSGWKKFSGLIKKLLEGFDLCLGQTETDAERLRHLGALNAKHVGNLKFAAPLLPADDGMLEKFRGALSDRPRWLAASTHPGEEKMVAAVHRRLKKKHPDLLTIIVPRHPDRGGEIAAELNAQGLAVSKRSGGDALGAGTDIYLADTLGELGLFFRLAGIAFMGKSLVPMGGQNPLEAAKLGCAIVHGPHMMNFEDITERLKGADAALEVADEAALEAAIGRLLDDAAECERLATAACDIAAAEAGVLDAVVGELQPYLDNLAEGESSHACA